MQRALVALVGIATAVLPLSWASVNITTAASPRPAVGPVLTPDQRMCTSPPTGAKVITGSPVSFASCALTTTVPGIVYINASSTLYLSPNMYSSVIEGKINVDGAAAPPSLRQIKVSSDTGPHADGEDKNFSTQFAGVINPGAHVFSLDLSEYGSGSATASRSGISAIFVPTTGTLSGCHNETSQLQVVTSESYVTVSSCPIDVPATSDVRITVSGQLNANQGPTYIMNSLIEVAGTELTDDDNAFVTASTYNTDRPNEMMTFAQQAVTTVGAGHHDFVVKMKTVSDGGFVITRPSIQVLVVPKGAPDASLCSASVENLTSKAATATTCSVTLPRAGKIQVLAGAQANGPTFGAYQAFYRLKLDSADNLDGTRRYMDMTGQGARAMVATQYGGDVTAGTHKVEFVIATGFTDQPAADTSVMWQSVLALFPAPDDPEPPVTTAPPVTTVPSDPGKPDPVIVDFVPLVPERVLDTRNPGQIGYVGAKPAAGATIELRVTGFGASNVPQDAKAVVLNLTGTEASSNGYVTAWPCGTTRPTASNLNVKAGSNVPNLVIAKVGDGGKVCLFTQPGQHLIADISGYMPGGSRYIPVVPDRVLETRADGQTGYSGPKPAAAQIIQLDVTGVGTSQLPDSAAAVVLNVTGTDAPSDGYVTVWPCGSPQPTASNLNMVVGTDRPNLVISKIGTNGKVCIFTQSGAELIADINGYLPAGTSYTPIVPARILDTRPANQIGYTADKPGPRAIVQLHVTGTGDSAAPANAAAVVLNVTGTDASGDGYITVWPCGAPQPNASNLNLTAGSTAPNLVISKIGDGGNVCLYTQSGTHLVADLAGYWNN